METPGAEESSLKVMIGRALNETLNSFTLDFDASIPISGQSGIYRLRAVIQMRWLLLYFPSEFHRDAAILRGSFVHDIM